MSFELSREQVQIGDSIAVALGRAGDSGAALGPMLAELGALSLLVPEDQGGMGLGMVEGAIACTEAGRHCLSFPLAETMLMAAPLGATMPQARDRVLAGLSCVTAPSSDSAGRREGCLSGTLHAAYVDRADWFVAPLDERHVAVMAMDGLQHTAQVFLEEGVATAVVDLTDSLETAAIVAMDLAAERLIILRCAEIVGAAAFCFETGVQYLKDRRQFGQPIGANQSLKHLAADGYVQLENIRVAVAHAAASMDRALGNPGKAASLEDAREAVCVVLSYVPETARELAELSIQFHGGIGVTWEYPLNRYLRRIIRLGQSLGSSGYHRRALLSRVAGEAAVAPSNSNPDIVRQMTP